MTGNTGKLLSFPQEIRNEVYQYFPPTCIANLGHHSLRATCYLIQQELDEEVIRDLTKYCKHFDVFLEQPRLDSKHLA
jgi:hypothetical protein